MQTQSHTTGPVMAAAVAPDGTPYFAQDSTAGVNVFRGLNGEYVKNVFPRCCGYAESLAVDTAGLVQVAFFSNATADGTFLYERLGADLTPAGSTELKPTGQHTDRVPLVADKLGNTFLAWPPGSPDATSLTVVPFRGGQPAGDGVGFRGPFTGGDPHMALALDAQDRLWIVWTGGGAVHAARSRSHGQHFGATVSVAVPGSMYQVSAAGIDGSPGSVDVVVNTGANLLQQSLQPGPERRRLEDDEEGRQEEGRHALGAGARRRLPGADRDLPDRRPDVSTRTRRARRRSRSARGRPRRRATPARTFKIR